MPYEQGVYEAVAAAFARKRRENRALFEQRQMELHQLSREILAIDRELSGTAFSVARAVLSKAGNTAELIQGLQLRNQELQLRRAQLLVEMGYPEDYLDYPYDCPKCKDEGYVDTKICSCMQQALKQEAMERLNRISGMSLCTFDSFSLHYYPAEPDPNTQVSPRRMMEAVLQFCRQYAEGFSMQSKNLFLFGSTGLGKTHLSLAIAEKVMEKGFGVVYGSVADLLAKVERERFSRGGGSDDSLQDLINCDLLILDDLGAEFTSQFTIAALYQILNNRLMGGRPTIINSNLASKELYDRYSERIMSRIVGNYETLRFLGADIRQLKKRERG